MTETQFQAADLAETNRRVALFTDLEEDGIVMGGLWEDKAPDFGYEIVYRAEFPVGMTNFASQVEEGMAADADIVIAQVIPPDGTSILRQMRASGYQPELIFMEKSGNTGGWPEITGGLGEGTLDANWFAEGMGTPRESEFIERYREELGA
jgi:branched-chain amino acid transport system substrate-binding protein